MSISALNSLYELGDDATNIQGMVYILPPESTEGDNAYGATASLVFRATTYTIPSTQTKTVEFGYRGSKYERMIPGDSEDTKTLTITFRVDKYWKVYDQLRAWKNNIFNATSTSGIAAEDVNAITGSAPNRSTIVIKTIDGRGEETGEVWTFERAYITSLSSIQFDQTSTGTPLTASATFDFVKLKNEYTDNNV